jgi:hypothetical protein
MSRALTRVPTGGVPALPTVEPGNAAVAICSLPPWLTSRLDAVSPWGEETEIAGRRRPTIPTSSTLTGEMRAALERRCAELEALTLPGPADATLCKVGEMVRFFSGTRIDETAVKVKLDVYLQAVGDLPAWAVVEAIGRWYRGEGPAGINCEFAPAPGVLRRIASGISAAAAGQIVSLRRLLDAVPMDGVLPREDRPNLDALGVGRAA